MSDYSTCWVVGAGAVGSALAGLIAQGGRAGVNLVGSSDHARAVKKNGLVLEQEDGPVLRPELTVYAPGEVPRLTGRDLVLLTGKASDLTAVTGWLKPKLDPAAGVLVLQNGMGPEQLVAEALGRPVSRGLLFFGARQLEPGHVRHRPRRVRLKPSPEAEAVCRWLEPTVMECQQVADFAAIEWRKLAINCVANPLAGILGGNNDQLAGAVLDPVKAGLLAEVVAVARAEGVDLEFGPADVNGILKGKNIASLRTDLDRGRPTEIDFLNGAVVELGQRHGLDCPVNAALVAMVKYLEQTGLV